MGPDAEHPAPSALCLSGGGIRSATFSLGVLQWMAQKGQLQDMHYVSTVSGGGYIGSWLVNSLVQARNRGEDALEWLNSMARGCGAAKPEDGRPPDPVAQLRAFSNYLSPTGGLSGDAFSLVAIFVRNLLLNVLVWLPLLAAAVALPRFYVALLGTPMPPFSETVWAFVIPVVMAHIVAGIAYVAADLPTFHPPGKPATPERRSRLRSRFRRWAFLLIVGAAVLLSVLGAWQADLRAVHWSVFVGAGVGAHLLGASLGALARISRGTPTRTKTARGAAAVIAVGALGGALSYLVLAQLGAPDDGPPTTDQQRLLYATFAVPAMTAAFWLAMTLYAGLMSQDTSESDREWWARATAQWLKFSLGWMAAFGLVIWLPLPILDRLGAQGPTAVQFGLGSGVLGVLTSLLGYWSKNYDEVKRKAQSVVNATGIKLLELMAGLVVLTVLLAISLGWSAALDRCHHWDWTERICLRDISAETNFLREQTALVAESEQSARDAAQQGQAGRQTVQDAESLGVDPYGLRVGGSAAARVYRHVLLAAEWWVPLGAGLSLLLLAGLFAWRMGANNFSLHGMYGNRLVRAYLGTGRQERKPHWFTDFDEEDNPPLSDFEAPLDLTPHAHAQKQARQPRLYPVINMALNMVRPTPERLDWQQRKAAPFIATPMHCGAFNVGFRSSKTYMGGMQLGRAMTISGAAATPNMGYHSSPLVGFVMTLFNVRLGWWAPHPERRYWNQKQPPLGIEVNLAEAFGSTGEDEDFVYLSDGGHFDNLGLFEMVRRRCRRIVVVDATCDGRYQWADLLDVVRKIRVDLGIEIGLPAVLPGPGRASEFQRFLEAPICYSARDGSHPDADGKLVVLKPMLLRDHDAPELAAYADMSAAPGSALDDPRRFPHQTTADPFFDERQFESYRLLGYLTAEAALGEQRGIWAWPKETTPPPRALAPAVPVAAAMRPMATGVGLGQAVGQWSHSAALAAALTVGGTLGVAGTVALAPAEISLSAADRTLLREGLSMRMEAAPLRLDPGDLQALRQRDAINVDASSILTSATELSKAAKDISSAADRLQQARTDAEAVKTIITRLQTLDEWIQKLTLAIGTGGASSSKALAATIADLNVTLADLNKKLPAEPGLTKAIDDLKNSIKDIGPRRNVRGQEGSR
ncbi:hypothetical protein GT347_05965 [Xylophilus rhododendri]|uniref:PNPLA domain-containing protein n=1 Tax=Xylophilus rhododendri TaxID=2697032 RepID=A0A857J3D8_9BURK|nr:hypothetical protein [Xylophilus rhododendri]QHI97572.1 hypothetical protein GT347_05965 [Xylophilus rhododendri]